MRKLLLISMLVTAIVQPVLGQGAEIRPEHARILDDAGWLDFVLENCDEVRYYDSTSLNVGGEGPYVGLAEFRNDRRIVHIATKNRSDVQIAEVLAHEAGHLSGLNIGNALADEATAEEHAERFRRDYRIAQARLGNDASDGTVPVQAPVGPAGWLAARGRNTFFLCGLRNE